MSVRLVSQSPIGFRALASGGQTAAASYDQIVRTLSQSLGADHADLFAEPSFRMTTVDWFTSFETDAAPVRLVEAPEPDREHGLDKLARLVRAIEGKAVALQKSDRAEERILGDILAFAIEIPEQGVVFLVGAQPVMTFWGYVLDQGRPAQSPLRALLGGRTGSPARPEVSPPAETEVEREVEVVAPETIAEPDAKIPEPAEEPDVVVPEKITPRPRVPPSRPWLLWIGLPLLLVLGLMQILASGLPRILNQTLKPPDDSKLHVPNAKELNAVLEGCWRAQEGIVARDSRKDINITLCFASGKGRRIIAYVDGSATCTGAIRPSVDGSNLNLELEPAVCRGVKNTFERARVVCRSSAGGVALCNEYAPDGKPSYQDHPFTRVSD